jgi:hypothetical protein
MDDTINVYYEQQPGESVSSAVSESIYVARAIGRTIGLRLRHDTTRFRLITADSNCGQIVEAYYQQMPLEG